MPIPAPSNSQSPPADRFDKITWNSTGSLVIDEDRSMQRSKLQTCVSIREAVKPFLNVLRRRLAVIRGQRRLTSAATLCDSLVTAGEFHFLVLVGRAGPNDRDDGDEGVNVVDVAHFTEGDHGGAFDVVDGAGVAVCNKGPDLGVVPRFESVEVEGRVSRVEGRGT